MLKLFMGWQSMAQAKDTVSDRGEPTAKASCRRGHLITLGDEPLFWISIEQRGHVVLAGTSLH